MSAWVAPFELAAVLLAVGGILKAMRPVDTANALRAFGLPVPRLVVRIGGAVEAAVACVALASGHHVAVALVGASYASFVGFLSVARLRRLPISSCGCFGRVDTPPSGAHLGLTLVAAIAAVAMLAQQPYAFSDVLARQPLGGVPYVFLLALGTWLAFLSLTSLPRLAALRARRAAP